jgi:hypothetical protein
MAVVRHQANVGEVRPFQGSAHFSGLYGMLNLRPMA